MEGRSNGSLRELVVLVVATKGPLQNLSPLPSTLSLLRSFSVSPLPKSNMAHKQMFHRIYEDRQLRRLLKVFARVNWAFESQSSPCWVFFSLLLRSCRLHSWDSFIPFIVDCTRKEFSLKSETTIRYSKPRDRVPLRSSRVMTGTLAVRRGENSKLQKINQLLHSLSINCD